MERIVCGHGVVRNDVADQIVDFKGPSNLIYLKITL